MIHTFNLQFLNNYIKTNAFLPQTYETLANFTYIGPGLSQFCFLAHKHILIIWLPNFFTLSAPKENYSRKDDVYTKIWYQQCH